MKRPHLIPRHFANWRWHYGISLALLLIAGTILFSVSLLNFKRSSDMQAVKRWQTVDALVVTSQITEADTSDEASFSTRLSVVLRFSFEVDGKAAQADYLATWLRRDYRDWNALLAPGNRIKIRVSPNDRSRVSLFDHNGIP